MSEITSLKSYLVGLGFSVNTSEFNKFKHAFNDASKLTDTGVAKIAKNIIKYQAAVTGMFLAVGAAIVGTVEKIASADQDYRLFGESMFMDAKHARSLKIAVDALGHSIEEIAFDPELYQRFQILQKDQAKLAAGLGEDYETTMRQIRDVSFEFTRFKVELQFFTMGFVKNLFQELGFGSGDFADSLKKINDYIIAHVPEWSEKFSKDFVPIIKDVWDIFKGLAAIVGDLAVDFTNLIAIFSGDDSLKTATFDFDKFAKAVEKVVHLIAEVVKGLEWVERKAGALTFLGGGAGAGIGGVIGGALGVEGGPVGIAAGAALGSNVGAGVGAGVGFLGHLIGRYGAATASDGTSSVASIGASGDGASEAREIAKKVSAKTGIPAQLIFAQMDHETGGFKNRGARELNNFAGINVPGGGGQDYRKFDSPDAFADYYAKLLSSKRYASQGLLQAKTPEEYAGALKRGGYMADSVDNYSRGLRGGVSDYYKGSGGNGDTTVNVGGVTVNNPASTVDVTKGVVDGVKQSQDKQTQRNLAELTPAYQ